MGRKLASIRVVSGFTSIEGADNIHLIHIDGWRVIARKTDFNIGDLCLYTEVDSLLPYEIPQFKFLEKWGTKKIIENGEIKQYYRIKTQRMRGTISQGLAVPLSSFPEFSKEKEGADLTDRIGVKHYDPESPMNAKNVSITTPKNKFIKFLCNYRLFRFFILPFFQKVRGAWPEWVSQTDEERAQNLRYNQVYENLKDKRCYLTEKVDYQSATFFTKTLTRKYFWFFKRRVKIFGVCSRTQWKKTKDNSLWWKIAEQYQLENLLRSFDHDMVIQGEQGNNTVQGNKYGLKGDHLFVFNIIDLEAKYHYTIQEMDRICQQWGKGLKTVPVLDTEFKLLPTVEAMVELSKGPSLLNPEVPREGIVVRLIENGQKVISFKVINPEFELKYN